MFFLDKKQQLFSIICTKKQLDLAAYPLMQDFMHKMLGHEKGWPSTE
jgi:hypothetical protein